MLLLACLSSLVEEAFDANISSTITSGFMLLDAVRCTQLYSVAVAVELDSTPLLPLEYAPCESGYVLCD